MFKLINSFLLESENEQQISILKFFMEQIDLAFSNKYSRKYSSDLLMMAYVIFVTMNAKTPPSLVLVKQRMTFLTVPTNSSNI